MGILKQALADNESERERKRAEILSTVEKWAIEEFADDAGKVRFSFSTSMFVIPLLDYRIAVDDLLFIWIVSEDNVLTPTYKRITDEDAAQVIIDYFVEA